MTGNDVSFLWNPVVLAVAVTVVAVILFTPWWSERYVRQELTRDTGVDRDSPAKAFAPGLPSNPPLVYFLELLYDGRVEQIVVTHRVGATVGLTDGSMVPHDRFGRVISRVSGDEVAYYRALGAASS